MGEEWSKKIEDTCNAIRSARIPLKIQLKAGVTGKSQKSIIKKPTDSDFHTACRDLFVDVLKYFPKDGNNQFHKINWSPDSIKTVREYLTKHNLQAKMVGPFLGTISMTTNGLEIGAAFGFFNRDHLIFVLDHERGHDRDHIMFKKMKPNLSLYLDKPTITLQQARTIIKELLSLIEQYIPATQINTFRNDTKSIFGRMDIPVAGDEYLILKSILSELFRYGEEIEDPRASHFALNFTPPMLRKLHLTKDQIITADQRVNEMSFSPLYLGRALIVAYLQEVGVWSQIKLRPDFDPTTVSGIDPRHIQFFRLCIQATVKLQKSFAASQKSQ